MCSVRSLIDLLDLMNHGDSSTFEPRARDLLRRCVREVDMQARRTAFAILFLLSACSHEAADEIPRNATLDGSYASDGTDNVKDITFDGGHYRLQRRMP